MKRERLTDTGQFFSRFDHDGSSDLSVMFRRFIRWLNGLGALISRLLRLWGGDLGRWRLAAHGTIWLVIAIGIRVGVAALIDAFFEFANAAAKSTHNFWQATAKQQQGDHQQDDPVDTTATAKECRSKNDR
jgi:hypothetical protein